jgi:ABC-type nitrate/sulfonate/bicarbonate transport system substrate-binding protein
MKEAVEFSKGHPDEMYAAMAKYTKLPQQVVSSIPVPVLQVDVSTQQIKFWIDLLKEQGGIKGSPDPEKILFQP